jgi:membrane protease subunit HflK
MNVNKREPLWLFFVTLIAHLLIALAGAACFLAWQLHPGRLLGILAAVGATASLGILLQGIQTTPEKALRRQEALAYLAWFLLIGVGGAFAVIGFLKTPRTLPTGIDKAFPLAVFFLAGAFAVFVVRRVVLLAVPSDARSIRHGLALWLANTFWSVVLASVALILLSIKLYQIAFWVTQILAYWCLLYCLEMIIRALVVAAQSHAALSAVSPNLLLFEAVYLGINPFSRLGRLLLEEYGINIGSSRLGPLLRRGVPLVFALLLISLWALSAFVVIQPHELGLRERFGRSSRAALEPGLHLKYPWPIERVLRFPAKRLLSMTIGYEALSQAQNMIWSRPHGRKEYRFPVGDARELISIDALLYYEIDDVFEYAYLTQNPDTILSCLAYAVLSERIVGSELDELLSVDRASLSVELAETLNQRITSERLGLQVVALCLESIHPPFEVATAYQRVVSSSLAKEARILRANAYREEVLPAAHAQAESLASSARADSCTRVGSAKGEAIAFLQTAKARNVAPDIFDQHLRLGALEATLEARRFVVLDRRISTSRLQPWIDLRTKSLSVPLDQAQDTFEDTAIPWEGEGAFQ